MHAYIIMFVFHRTFMESTTLLSLSCVVCFVIYYELAGVSYIKHISSNNAVVSQ